jgi:gamma-glutamylcyclotransferase (GGCT)/AIG2-like uncharacterized protein YtfP
MPRGNIKMTYFLQYGTSMLDRTLDRRVDTMRLEGQGKLSQWRMDFSRQGGQPNLVSDASASVWGLLYLIEEHKLPELDKDEPGTRHEGVCSFEGKQEKCVFYTYPSASDKPGAEYIERLREVYRQASLPQAQIDKALGLVKA